MARKKKSEMTYMERVDRELKGASWDEAEEIGIEILARTAALHIYARKEGEEYLKHLLDAICKRAITWTQEGNHATMLALAGLGNELKKEN